MVHFYHTSIVVSLSSFRELSESRTNCSCETDCPQQADHRHMGRWLSWCARHNPFLGKLGFSPVNREDTQRSRFSPYTIRFLLFEIENWRAEGCSDTRACPLQLNQKIYDNWHLNKNIQHTFRSWRSKDLRFLVNVI